MKINEFDLLIMFIKTVSFFDKTYENTTLAILDKSFSVYASCITINTSMAILLKLWKVVRHYSQLLFVSTCPFRSDIVTWSSSLSASIRPDHMCGYSYHQGITFCRQYMNWHMQHLSNQKRSSNKI